MRAKLRFIAPSLLWICLLNACDSSELSPSKTLRKPLGTIEFAAGNERFSATFGGVSCFQENNREVMILQSNQQIAVNRTPQIPDLLRVEIGPTEESLTRQNDGFAIAYLPNEVMQGSEYPMVMFVAQDLEGVGDYSCVLKRNQKARELTCQNVLIVPWRQPTKQPQGAFKAAFSCP